MWVLYSRQWFLRIRSWKACCRDAPPPSFHSKTNLFLRYELNNTFSRVVCSSHNRPASNALCVFNVVTTGTHLPHRCVMHMAITVQRACSCLGHAQGERGLPHALIISSMSRKCATMSKSFDPFGDTLFEKELWTWQPNPVEGTYHGVAQ